MLVVSAVRGEFEVGVSKVGETRDHLQIGYTMNVKQVVVAVNKMDKAKYKEVRLFIHLLIQSFFGENQKLKMCETWDRYIIGFVR